MDLGPCHGFGIQWLASHCGGPGLSLRPNCAGRSATVGQSFLLRVLKYWLLVSFNHCSLGYYYYYYYLLLHSWQFTTSSNNSSIPLSKWSENMDSVRKTRNCGEYWWQYVIKIISFGRLRKSCVLWLGLLRVCIHKWFFLTKCWGPVTVSCCWPHLI
jgi:hypothetical protein